MVTLKILIYPEKWYQINKQIGKLFEINNTVHLKFKKYFVDLENAFIKLKLLFFKWYIYVVLTEVNVIEKKQRKLQNKIHNQ